MPSPSALPIRERRMVRESLSGRLHRRIHAQTRGWFTHFTCCATSLFDRPAFRTCVPWHRPRRDGRRCRRASTLPVPNYGVRHICADAMRWPSAVIDDPARRRFRVRERPPRERPSPSCCTMLNTYSSSRVRQRGRVPARRPNGIERTHSTSTSLESCMPSQRASPRDGCIHLFPPAALSYVPRRADQLYVRRSRERFWLAIPRLLTCCDVLTTMCQVAAPLLR